MTITDIIAKYNSGGYTYKADIPKKVWDNHIFDEDLSVKRNRELAKEHNDNVDRLEQYASRRQNELDEQLTYDVVKYIMDNYNLDEKQARLVESFVYSEKHAFMCDYFSYIDEYAIFAENLTKKAINK